jgi:hypothetical protein
MNIKSKNISIFSCFLHVIVEAIFITTFLQLNIEITFSNKESITKLIMHCVGEFRRFELCHFSLSCLISSFKLSHKLKKRRQDRKVQRALYLLKTYSILAQNLLYTLLYLLCTLLYLLKIFTLYYLLSQINLS